MLTRFLLQSLSPAQPQPSPQQHAVETQLPSGQILKQQLQSSVPSPQQMQTIRSQQQQQQQRPRMMNQQQQQQQVGSHVLKEVYR